MPHLLGMKSSKRKKPKKYRFHSSDLSPAGRCPSRSTGQVKLVVEQLLDNDNNKCLNECACSLFDDRLRVRVPASVPRGIVPPG